MSACGLCARSLDDAAEVGTTSRWGLASRRVACLQCGLVQVCPQPTQGELKRFYSSHEYRNQHGPVPIHVTQCGQRKRYEPGTEGYEYALRAMAEFRYDWTSEIGGLVRGMRVLEIGCGDGRTLERYGEAGLVCTGVEPDVEEAEKAKARNPDATIHATTYEDAPLEGPYDAIVNFHVLEHLNEPIQALKDWKALLTPRGVMAIEVPDILNPGFPIDEHHFQWVHLFDFSSHTLAGCLIRAGLEPVRVMERGVAIRVVARPATGVQEFQVPHGGAYVQGYLDGLRRMVKAHG